MNLIIMIFLISLLVLVHEWGHYIAARIFGVRVSKFGIGMPIGPTLFKTKKGDLEILVHACLLGGYVSFPDDEENNKETDEPTLPKDSPERLMNKPAWQRAIIISAGVIMNVIFAFILIVFAASVFQKLPTGKSDIYVNGFVENGVIAKEYPNTLKDGDKIIKVNGLDIDSTYKFIFLVQNSKNKDGKIKKEVSDKKLDEILKLNPSLTKDSIVNKGAKIYLPVIEPEEKLIVSDEVARGLDKFNTGEIELNEKEIKLRDLISGKKLLVSDNDYTLRELANALSDSHKPLDIVVERNNYQIEFKNIMVPSEGVLGIKLASKDLYVETKNLKDIFIHSAKYMTRSTKYMCYGLWQLVTGKIPASEMHGIIAITKIGSDIIEHQGMLNALLLTAIISINLAIINLLPIPALDGGHLMFILIEKIKGKPLDEKTIENISKVFFMLLIILMVLVLFNDVWALIIGKF